MKRRCFTLVVLLFLGYVSLNSQNQLQFVRGVVTDIESGQLLSNVAIFCTTSSASVGCTSDSAGCFAFKVPLGRHSFSFSRLGYNSVVVSDINVEAGKQLILNMHLEEKIYSQSEVEVRASHNPWLNTMATVSARTLSSQDAARYAGGYYDMSRMVVNYAGVTAGDGDANNEIVVRGNTPKGMLWRIEGIEIPNPNHFTLGQGSSGGAFSSITTNVLSDFDFFMGSFPSEYSNATSGVMDLNLRRGNMHEYEFSAVAGGVGFEASGEGPLLKNKTGSFMLNMRTSDMTYLASLGIIKSDDYYILPKSSDFVFKSSFLLSKAGQLDLFAMGGNSTMGDQTIRKSSNQGEIREVDIEKEAMFVAGVKHSMAFADNKTYLRNTLAFTYEEDAMDKLYSDESVANRVEHTDHFNYPALRLASLINRKIDARNSLRAGLTANLIWGNMFATSLNSYLANDTLIDAKGSGYYGSLFAQWKFKPLNRLEFNAGFNTFLSGITHEVLIEPRFGVALSIAKRDVLSLGMGVHSKLEPLSVYNYRVSITSTMRAPINRDLKATKALHLTAGWRHIFAPDISCNIEAYYQHLYAVPINEGSSGQYCVLNTNGGLPNTQLSSNGIARNKGVEITLEKPFSKGGFLLFSASFFDSRYKAADGRWYSTFFDTDYIVNAIGGKEFKVGAHKRNVFGVKVKSLVRGGFRYTPVDSESSLSKGRIIYQSTQSYGRQLPMFHRTDFGCSYAINRNKSSWSFMMDIQDVFNSRNVIQRKFQYQPMGVTSSDVRSIGLVPVFSVKYDF